MLNIVKYMSLEGGYIIGGYDRDTCLAHSILQLPPLNTVDPDR